MTVMLYLAGCGGSSSPRGGAEDAAGASSGLSADRDRVLRGESVEKAESPLAGGPAAPAPVDPSGSLPGEGGGVSGLPGEMVRAPASAVAPALSGDRVALLRPVAEAESVKKQACQYKYNQCLAGVRGDDYAVEKQRGCVSAYNTCLADKTEEAKCEDGYNGCLASIPEDAYKIEAQRACLKGREHCLATKVYPGCCTNAYNGCLAAIPAGEYRREQERGCVSVHDQCMARYYCE
ncbi:MAG: hypothetical protein IT572_04890 [Deltaproteobacteria bacterium]|nr:hypothetical protein [Deltaproteobacteria bacterium]